MLFKKFSPVNKSCDVTVELNSIDATFQPGDRISGTLKMDVNNSLHGLKYIKLELVGFSGMSNLSGLNTITADKPCSRDPWFESTYYSYKDGTPLFETAHMLCHQLQPVFPSASDKKRFRSGDKITTNFDFELPMEAECQRENNPSYWRSFKMKDNEIANRRPFMHRFRPYLKHKEHIPLPSTMHYVSEDASEGTYTAVTYFLFLTIEDRFHVYTESFPLNVRVKHSIPSTVNPTGMNTALSNPVTPQLQKKGTTSTLAPLRLCIVRPSVVTPGCNINFKAYLVGNSPPESYLSTENTGVYYLVEPQVDWIERVTSIPVFTDVIPERTHVQPLLKSREERGLMKVSLTQMVRLDLLRLPIPGFDQEKSKKFYALDITEYFQDGVVVVPENPTPAFETCNVKVENQLEFGIRLIPLFDESGGCELGFVEDVHIMEMEDYLLESIQSML